MEAITGAETGVVMEAITGEGMGVEVGAVTVVETVAVNPSC